MKTSAETTSGIFRSSAVTGCSGLNRSGLRQIAPACLALFLFFGFAETNAQNANGQNNGNNNTETENEEDIVIEGGGLVPLANNGNGNANGNGNQSCTIMVTQTGTLGSGIENLEMNSKFMGGRAGQAQVTTTNGSYTLSLDTPLGFSAAPAEGSSNVNMAASFIGTGETNFSETPGNINIRLRRGLTNVQTHLSAKRADTTPFPAGYYSTAVTLRCE